MASVYGSIALVGLGFACLTVGLHSALQPKAEEVRVTVGPAARVTPVAPAEPPPLAPAGPQVRPKPPTAEPVELLFPKGSTRVDPTTAKASLMPLIEALEARFCRKLLVDGHSDGVGDRVQNLELSWHRAQATRRWLVYRGVPDDRIVVRSFGAYQPKLSASPDAEEQRRVEVRLLECPTSESSL